MTNHQALANAIRFLSIDAVERANSGHPGMPMGMADIATVLWQRYLSMNPSNPNWFNRDRFVLSNGHGSMLQYALLHLSGYDVSLDDLKQFRQLHSKTPGHPEYQDCPGIETTTGPLGQGLANGVGMAIAETRLAQEFNTDDHAIIDHFTYVFCGDGCLMEGISHEVCSLAGTLGLGKLIVFYDDNGISIDGKVSGWFSDDTPARFKAYQWHVIDAVDGHDPEAIATAIEAARANRDQPTLICAKTHIGFGSPNKVDTAGAHGAPLGEDEIALTRQALDWPHAPFDIPEAIRTDWNQQVAGQAREATWNEQFAQYESAHPERAAELLRRLQGHLPEGFTALTEQWIHQVQQEQQPTATRKSSQQCLQFLLTHLPELMGGSADLSGSNCTRTANHTSVSKAQPNGNYIDYGVREFGMSAIANGLALHGGIVPYTGTFLVFSDYARNAVRLSALMQQKTIYVYTHDSIGLGEDGPTHQPIEHINMLRMTPNLAVWRPADSTETAVAWQQALHYQGPSALLLSRQTLPAYARTDDQLQLIARGGYVLQREQKHCDVILIATGSELDIVMEAHEQLQHLGIDARVVSMPSVDVFKQQSTAYQESVLPPSQPIRIAVEAGTPDSWYRFVGPQGRVIGIEQFGHSAPYQQVYQALGITTEAICATAQQLLQQPVTS